MSKQNYIFCRDFWFGEQRQSDSILEIYQHIPNLIFRDIMEYNSYADVRNSNVIFIGEIPERVEIFPDEEFFKTNTIFLHYHLEGSIITELRKSLYSSWIYLLYFDAPEINNFLINELKYQTINIKFYLPTKPQVDFKIRRLGYWNRTGLYCSEVINRIIEKLYIDCVYIYDHPNGGYPYLEKDFLNRIKCDNIYYLDGRENRSRETYIRFMENCNIYLCPRRVESCGISNLEQMVRGCFVIGMDLPSMNNYIKHKETGFLINNDFSNLNDLENMDIQQIGMNMRMDCINGFNEFKENFKTFIDKYFI